jgi:hypothetical protein
MRGVLLIGLLFVAVVAPSAGSSAPREQASRLVFAATVAYVGGEPQTQIYALEPSGRGLAQLTFGAAPASTPVPSPDGRRIAFERGSSIWVMRPNGSGKRLLAPGSEPAWAPDSRRLAYVADDGIHLIGSGGSGDRLLVAGRVRSPAWSPDGKTLAFARNASLVVLRDGVQRTLVTLASPFIDQIAWSADGRWLAFNDGSAALHVVRADGQRRRDLSGIVARPSWSPTKPWLAYVTAGAQGGGDGSVDVLDPASGSVHKLGDAAFANALAWSPSGSAIVVSGNSMDSESLNSYDELLVLTLTGRVRKLIEPGAQYRLPEAVAWTMPPPGLRYRKAVPVGPLVTKDELRFRVPVEELAADGDRVAFRLCGTVGVWRPGDATVVSVQADRPLCGENSIGFFNLALGGDRVAWGIVEGGIQRSSSLVVGTVGDQASRAVVAAHFQIAGDSRGDERAGYLLGQGTLLAFSSWAFCDDVVPLTCPGLGLGQGTTIASQTLWRVRDSSWPETCPA